MNQQRLQQFKSLMQQSMEVKWQLSLPLLSQTFMQAV